MSLSTTAKLAPIACALMVAFASAAQAAGASCTTAARDLAKLVSSEWPSSGENTAGSVTDMVSMVSRKSSPRFVSGRARFKLAEYSRPAFARAVRQLPKPFAPSSELLKALDDLQGAVTFFELPGSKLLAAKNIGGTANCNSTIFFSVRGGRADLVPSPNQWENDVGGSCGLTRSFASVSGTPVIIDDSLDSAPSLVSTLTLTPWNNGKWQEPCTASFSFAPHFDAAKTLNDWPNLDNWEANDCGAAGCAKFQRAALDLVKRTQQDRAGVEDHLRAAMTTARRAEYQRLKDAAHGTDQADPPSDGEDGEKPRTAANLTETNPLLLPMVIDDHVFLASVGHLAIGWRVFADWKVTVEAAEADRVREIARFAVGMTQGPIAGIAIK